jgi:hypothetical protein
MSGWVREASTHSIIRQRPVASVRAAANPYCAERLHIAASDGPYGPADVFISVVVEVRERDAAAPVWSLEAAAVPQDDAVVLGRAEDDVEQMHVRLHPGDKLLAEILTDPKLEVELAIVGGIEQAAVDFEAEALQTHLKAAPDDLHAAPLIALLRVQQLASTNKDIMTCCGRLNPAV